MKVGSVCEISFSAGLERVRKLGWRKQRRSDSGSQDPITPVLFIIHVRIIVIIIFVSLMSMVSDGILGPVLLSYAWYREVSSHTSPSCCNFVRSLNSPHQHHTLDCTVQCNWSHFPVRRGAVQGGSLNNHSS